MGLELLPKVTDGGLLTNYGVHTNGPDYVFEFSDTVYLCVVGLWGFWLQTTGGPTSIQNFSLSVVPAPLTGGNTVSVSIQAVLDDGHGHHIDDANSWVIPVCLALTGSSESGYDLNNLAEAIPSNMGASVPSLPIPPLAAYGSVLSGFDLSYGTSNYNVFAVAADTSMDLSDRAVGATASMHDGGNHDASVADIFAGYFALSKSLGLLVANLSEQTTAPFTTKMGGTGFTQAAVMITGFNAQYVGNDHWVHVVSANPLGAWDVNWQPVSINGSAGTVTLPGFQGVMNDGGSSPHYQDDSKSYLNGLLLTL